MAEVVNLTITRKGFAVFVLDGQSRIFEEHLATERGFNVAQGNFEDEPSLGEDLFVCLEELKFVAADIVSQLTEIKEQEGVQNGNTGGH